MSEKPETDALAAADEQKRDDDSIPFSAYERMKELCGEFEQRAYEAEAKQKSIQFANYYGKDDGRYPLALLLEKALEVAIDAWVDGNNVTVQLCKEEVEHFIAAVIVQGQDATLFSVDAIYAEPTVQEVWMPRGAINCFDHARKLPEQKEDIL